MPECRICYEEDEEDKFIWPCACNGTQKFVHADCLDKWRKVNINRIAFLQCPECKQWYNIGKTFLRETLTFSFEFPVTSFEVFGIVFFNFGVMFFSGVIKTIDKLFRIPEAMSLGGGAPLIKILKESEALSYCYYYSFSTFITTILVYSILFFTIQYNIRYKMRYWKYAIVPYFSTMVFNYHYYYFYLLILANSPEMYIYFTGLCSLFNLFFILFFLHTHDDIIKNLNTVKNEDIIINYKHTSTPRRQYQENIVITIEE